MLSSIRATIQSKVQELQQQSVSKIIKKTALITAVAIAAVGAANGLAYLYNGTIDRFDCYPRSIFSSLRPKGMNLFCSARDMEAIAEKEELIKVRDLYKQAFEEGVLVAKDVLCRPKMFPDAGLNHDLVDEFGSICCPPPPKGSVCELTECPWGGVILPDYSQVHVYEE